MFDNYTARLWGQEPGRREEGGGEQLEEVCAATGDRRGVPGSNPAPPRCLSFDDTPASPVGSAVRGLVRILYVAWEAGGCGLGLISGASC